MAVMQQNKRNRLLLGADRNALVWLIVINVLAFILIYFMFLVYNMSNSETAEFHYTQLVSWFNIPARIELLVTRPWVIFISMFIHDRVMGLVSTVLWLWGFGYILQDLTGNKKIIPIYIYGGLAGAIFFTLSIYAIPAFRNNIYEISPMIGGGSAVMAIAIATTALAPKLKLLPMINGGIPLWVLTTIFAIIDLASAANISGAVAIAHLAGAAAGFLFVKQLEKGRDWSAWINNFFDWIMNLFNPEKKYNQVPVKQQHFYKTDKKPFEKASRFSQQKLDEILDKINTDGYASLSKDEKEFLKKASKEDL